MKVHAQERWVLISVISLTPLVKYINQAVNNIDLPSGEAP